MKTFVLGALTGGVVVWFWGGEIREFIDRRTLGLRLSIAARLQATADTLQGTANKLQDARRTIESGFGHA